MKKKILLLTIAFFIVAPVAAFANTLFYGQNSTITDGNLTDGIYNAGRTITPTTTTVNYSWGTRKIISQIKVWLVAGDGATRSVRLELLNAAGATSYSQTFNTTNAAPNILVPNVEAWGYKLFSTSNNFTIAEVRLFEVPDTTPPANPVLTATGGNLSINLTWTTPPDGDLNGYNLYKGATLLQENINKTTTSYTESGLMPGSVHTYTIKAFDLNGNLSSGSTATATATDTQPPTTPTTPNVYPSDNQLIFTWAASTDNHIVSKYEIYKVVLGSDVYQGQTTSTSFTDTGLINDFNYTYKVVAVDASGNKSGSLAISGTPKDVTPPFDVSTISAGYISDTAVKILFDYSTATDIDYYEVSANPGSHLKIVDHIGLSHEVTFTGLTSGETYNFVVKAVDDDGLKSSGLPLSHTMAADPPAVPTGLTVIPDDNKNTLNWTDNTESDFAIYRIYLQGVSNHFATSTTSNFNHTSLTNTQQKCYQIAAVDTSGNVSNKSLPVCGTPIDLYPPFDITDLTPGSTTEYTYKMTWTGSSSPDISYYKLMQNGSQVDTVYHVSGKTDYEYLYTGLTPGTTYIFAVHSVDDDGLVTVSSLSYSGSTTGTPPATPTNFNKTNAADRITFTWTANTESDLNGYKLYKNGLLIATLPDTATSYIYLTTDTTPGTFELKAFDIGGSLSSAATLTAAAAPPAALFGGTSPITGTAATTSIFGLLKLLAPYLLIFFAFWFAMKFLETKQKAAQPVTSKETTDEKPKRRKKRTPQEIAESKRINKLQSDLRKKMSKSVGYKIYKK